MAVDTHARGSDQEFSPEFRLLSACARKTLQPIDSERIVNLSREPLDWALFLNLVGRHRVAPLVWQSLEATGEESTPDQLQGDLRRVVRRNSLMALRQAADLVKLVRRFEGAGVRVLPLKGPALALQAYGALKLRHTGDDLDLLVDPATVGDADRILKEAGYFRTSPEYSLNPGQAAAYMKIRKDFSYSHPESDIEVELHWRWSQNAHLFPLSFDELWPKLESVGLGSGSVPAMPRQELLLYLSAHGAHTGWFRLKWLCDIAELLGDDLRAEMPQVVARARELGVARMLTQALLLVHQVLDFPLPDELSPEMRQDRTVQGLVEMGTRALVLDERNWSTDDTPLSWMPAQLRYRLKLRKNSRYKWHNAYFYSLWTKDCGRIRLPKGLFPLYFLVAPMLWLVSILRGLIPSSGGPRRS